MITPTRPERSRCPSCATFDALGGYARKSEETAAIHKPNIHCILCRGAGMVKTEVAARFYEAYNQSNIGFIARHSVLDPLTK
jgi:hypothetical protein